MRVATYNIHRAIGADRKRDPARIARVIAALRADIVGLQEVDWHDGPSRNNSPYEVLHHLPGYETVDGPNLRALLPRDGGHVGCHGRDDRLPWHDQCLGHFLAHL